uniref:Uncharacterized protein n=1 Tax=Populus trichocarpa TaxID=3694 RepID=A0A2K1X8T7_POPTR
MSTFKFSLHYITKCHGPIHCYSKNYCPSTHNIIKRNSRLQEFTQIELKICRNKHTLTSKMYPALTHCACQCMFTWCTLGKKMANL